MANIKKGAILAGAAFLATLVAAPADAGAQGSWATTQTSSGSSAGADCDPSVQTRQEALTKQKIAGDLGLAKTFYTPMPPGQGFYQSSCIGNLLSGQGLSILFSPPDIDQILAALANYVCQKGTQLFQQATAPLTQALSSGSLPLGQAIPGVNLAPALGGLSYSSSMGSGGIGQTGGPGTVGFGVKTNLRQALSGGSPIQIQPFNMSSYGSAGGSGSSGLFAPASGNVDRNGYDWGPGGIPADTSGNNPMQNFPNQVAGGFLSTGYDNLNHTVVGTGQCVALAQATNPSIGQTATWVQGSPVEGNTSIAPGTVIATFDSSGRYANALDGSSHTAIFLGKDANGIQVMDQWSNHAASYRTIRWSNPSGIAADTGSKFYVVSH